MRFRPRAWLLPPGGPRPSTARTAAAAALAAAALAAAAGPASAVTAPSATTRPAADAAKKAGPAVPASTAAQAPSSVLTPAEKTAAADAGKARRAVEVPDQTTDVSQVMANPDGTFTKIQYFTPQRVKQNGAWTPIDDTLVRAADGTWAPKASETSARFSGGGGTTAVALSHGDQKLTLDWPTALPAPTVSGPTATYANVLPGVDLVLTATPTAYQEVLVVHDAAAAADPALKALPMTITGTNLSVRADGDGTISTLDTKGKEVFRSSPAMMWDSSSDPHTGPAPTAADPGSGRQTPLAVRPAAAGRSAAGSAADSGGAASLTVTLTPPASALTGPGVKYPLYIDPIFSYNSGYWATISSLGTSYGTYDTGSFMRVGYCGWATCNYDVLRSFLSVDTSYLVRNGVHAAVTKSTLYVTSAHSATCTSEPTELWSAGGVSGTLTWGNQVLGTREDTESSAGGTNDSCSPSTSPAFNDTAQIQQAAAGNWPTAVMALKAPDETSGASCTSGNATQSCLEWKQFWVTGTTYPPHLDTIYNFPPSGPSPASLGVGGAVTCTGTPYVGTAGGSGKLTYSAQATDNNPNGASQLRYFFQTYAGSNGSGSKVEDPYGGPVPQGSGPASYQTTFTGWANGGQYSYRATDEAMDTSGYNAAPVWAYTGASGDNGTNYSNSIANAPWYNFTVLSQAPPTPTIASPDFPLDQYGNPQWGAPQGYGQLNIGDNGGVDLAGFLYAFDSGGALASPTLGNTDCGVLTALTATGTGRVPENSSGATLPIPPSLTPGHHTVYVRSFDQAHNISGMAVFEFMVSPNYLQSATAAPTTGSITNPMLGRCVDDLGAHITAGSPVGSWECAHNDNQTWTLNTNGTLTSFNGGTTPVCLDTAGNPAANGTLVVVDPCSGAAGQKWTAQSNGAGYWQLVDTSGLCLDEPGGNLADGTQLQVYGCLGNTNQAWSIDLDPNRITGPDLLHGATATGSAAAHDGWPGLTAQSLGDTAANHQLWWYGTEPAAPAASSITIPFTTALDARYALGIRLTTATDYADVRFTVDQNGTHPVTLSPAVLTNSGGVFDAYQSSCCGHTYIPLGGLHLGGVTGTSHTLTITVTGHDPANTAASPDGVGVDYLEVAPYNGVTASSLSTAMNNAGISDDTSSASMTSANLDWSQPAAVTDTGTTGRGSSLSKQALATAGLIQGGNPFTVDGFTFAMPAANSSTHMDNTVAIGQTVTLDQSQQIRANAVGMLVASTCGTSPQSTMTVTYADGSTDVPVTPPVDDWSTGPAGSAAYNAAYRNSPSGKVGKPVRIYLVMVPTNTVKTLTSITLPYFYVPSSAPGSCPTSLHVLAVGVRPQATGGGTDWLGAWAATPDTGATPPGGTGFAGQTLREVVHPTILGSGTAAAPVQARIRFSNRFGTAPLQISAATLAAQTGTGAGTVKPPVALAFGGAAGVTIQPGAEVYSDAVTLPDTSSGSGNLDVSLYLASAVTTAPVHNGATEPVWAATGNQTTDTAGAAATWATSLPAWYFVTGLDVTTIADQATVAVLGDQISAGGAPATWVDDAASQNDIGTGTPSAPAPQGTVEGFANLSTTAPITAAGTANSLGQQMHNWWRLADGSGTTAADVLGNSPLTLSGGTSWSTDKPANGSTAGSLTLNGTTGYAATAASVIDTSQSFTASAWVKLPALIPGNHEAVSADGANTSGFMLGYSSATGSTGAWWVFLPGDDTAGAGGPTMLAPAGSVQVNTWTHLAVVYNAGAKTASLYVNGTLIASQTGVVTFKAPGPLVVGRSKYDAAATDFFGGNIADVQVYQQALSSAAVQIVAAGWGADSAAGNALNAGVLAEPNLDTVVLALGANDMLHGDTAPVIEGNIRALIQDLKYGISQDQAPSGSAVVQVIVATVPPVPGCTGACEAVRERFNQDVSGNDGNWGAAGTADLASAVTGSLTSTTVKTGDMTGTTPNAHYYQDIANTVVLANGFVWGANAIDPAGLTAGLSVTPAGGGTPLAVTANASSTAQGSFPISSYKFDFGDGTAAVTQAGNTAAHTYASSGTYTVRMTVTDASGYSTTASQAVTVGTELYQLHASGNVWAYTGTQAAGWIQIDANVANASIAANGTTVYERHTDGSVWVYTGTPGTGWTELDNKAATTAIATSSSNKLYELHGDGSIWLYTGTPTTGWQEIGNTATTTAIATAGNGLYQLHADGSVWTYTGTPLTGWTELDGNAATSEIAAAGSTLDELHGDGSIWAYTGTPMTGWQEIGDTATTTAIAVGGTGTAYQLRSDGSIWVYTGTPITGWTELDNNATVDGIRAGDDGSLYELHSDSSIWQYTGTPLTGWQKVDSNTQARQVVAGASGTALGIAASGGIPAGASDRFRLAGDATDALNSAFNGTTSGGVGYVTNDRGPVTAARFDGSSGVVKAPGTAGSAPIATTGSFTVSAWVNLTNGAHASSNEAVVAQNGTQEWGFFLGYRSDTSQWRFAMQPTDDANVNPSNVYSAALAGGQFGGWTLLTGVYDGTGHRMYLYVNGVLVGSGAFTSTVNFNQQVVVGGGDLYQGAGTDYLDGDVSDVLLYNGAALSAQQVQQLYTSTR